MTIKELKSALPGRSRKLLSESVVGVLNQIEQQEGHEFSEAYRNNFMGFSKIMENPEYTMESYVDALKYTSFRLMDHTSIDSYMMAFPDRYTRLMDLYGDLGDEAWIRSNKIASYASAYNKGKIVNEMLSQAAVPVSILNMDLFQRALNVEAHLMDNANSETVRQLAAKSSLEILKPADIQRVELDIGLKENDVIADLRSVTQSLALQQQTSIRVGSHTSSEVCDMTIVDVSIEEDD
ncbi:MAG: hypothetical protein DRP20_05665 [Thermotogae bacterium]|nr:MAG: hypothetical protein DRP20_05665 [Thermotogota bacterium]